MLKTLRARVVAQATPTQLMFGPGVALFVNSLVDLIHSKVNRFRKHSKTFKESISTGPRTSTRRVTKCFKPYSKEIQLLDPLCKVWNDLVSLLEWTGTTWNPRLNKLDTRPDLWFSRFWLERAKIVLPLKLSGLALKRKVTNQPSNLVVSHLTGLTLVANWLIYKSKRSTMSLATFENK